MQEVNWNNFKTKFHGRERTAFEYLSYLLFCREHKLQTGIFRYKNQAGIESEPVLIEGQWIGFQSKFFDNQLSQRDIEGSILTAKLRNTNLDKIFIYLNLEFSESSKKGQKKPKSQTNLETFAVSKGVEIEWRVPSHIEAQLSLPENRNIALYFFSLEKGVIDSVNELVEHTAAILRPIRSSIRFADSEIKLDRSVTLSRLSAALLQSATVIVSGFAGVGKTGLIKDFVETLDSNVPFFIFKANEFRVSHINELFNNYGTLSLGDFVNEFSAIHDKYVVIDSAESLSDLDSLDAFQELLSTLIRYQWKIIFTTRFSYVDDLKFQFVDIYRLPFELLAVENLSSNELERISVQYAFALPTDERFFELLKNPFYLDMYLQIYRASEGTPTIGMFKSLLWDRKIAKKLKRANNVDVKRETCFLNLAKARAELGGFSLANPIGCDDEVLRQLENDEIIERDSKSGSYFITHDIYEEWALEKLIDIAFLNSTNHTKFFESLGNTLPIRRAFRKWLGEMLAGNPTQIAPLIEASFTGLEIESYWRDEIIVSTLLSDYSETFFTMFQAALLDNHQQLLVRVIFMLKIACKEIDETLLKMLGVSKEASFSLKTVLVRPKGSGWQFAIKFIYENFSNIDQSHRDIILSLLADWHAAASPGSATRFAGLLALQYYDQDTKSEIAIYRRSDRLKTELVPLLISTSAEIESELQRVFEEIKTKNDTRYRAKHYDFVRLVLGPVLDSAVIAKSMPRYVLRLANLAWYEDPNEELPDRVVRIWGVDDGFCVSAMEMAQHPPSAFQTPTLQLLQHARQETIDFLLDFINKCVECYAQSGMRDEIAVINVFVGDDEIVTQSMSARLWNTYRGTLTAPDLLESLHMALERWLLQFAKSMPAEETRAICIYLLRKTRSASITAVVASVVLAYPAKLFEVARLLFKSKELILADTMRMAHDRGARSLYSIGAMNPQNKMFTDERLETCKDPHRQGSLEQLVLGYQIWRFEGESDEVVSNRQELISKILDKHYADLPSTANEGETDKVWRIALARMDRRKMSVVEEDRNGQTRLQLRPELDPELVKFSEEATAQSEETLRQGALFQWAQTRWNRRTEGYSHYRNYEDDPKSVIAEVLSIRNPASGLVDEFSERFFNQELPGLACAVLVRDFADALSAEDMELCKEILIEYASRPLNVKQYVTSSSDGAGPAILSLPAILMRYPDERPRIITILLLLLLHSSARASHIAVRAIVGSLWETNWSDANSLFIGYLYLSPKYDALWQTMRDAHYREYRFTELSTDALLKRFQDEFADELEKSLSGDVSIEHTGAVAGMDLDTLITAFELLPLTNGNPAHEAFVSTIVPVFAARVFANQTESLGYELRHRFFEKFAQYVLTSRKDQIENFVRPFVEEFNEFGSGHELLESFIWAEDRMERYEEFWIVWRQFYENIVKLSADGAASLSGRGIIHTYLLAWSNWKDNAKEWHSVRPRERLFFKRVSEEMRSEPGVLYSLSKVLTDVGSPFLDDGIGWIATMLDDNDELRKAELETNTLYYLELVIRKFIFTRRTNIRTSAPLKQQVLVILNFLVEKGSARGYLLRENIL